MQSYGSRDKQKLDLSRRCGVLLGYLYPAATVATTVFMMCSQTDLGSSNQCGGGFKNSSAD